MADYSSSCTTCGGWLKHKDDCSAVIKVRRLKMGSGEGDAIHVGVVTDLDDKRERRHQIPTLTNNSASVSLGGSMMPHSDHPFWNPYNPTSTTNSMLYTSPVYIYMYQIRCPNCEVLNFMQLEMITPCKKCKSKLKPTQKVADYEVPVEL